MTTRQPRDYAQDMAAAIEAAIPEGDFVSTLVAAELVAKLRATDAELLTGWLDASAVAILAHVISTRERQLRTKSRVQAKPRAFAKAKADPKALSVFRDIRYVVDEHQTRRPLGDMSGPDLRYAAAGYQREEQRAALERAFLLALARKVGKRRVRDVLTEAKVQRLRDGMVPE